MTVFERPLLLSLSASIVAALGFHVQLAASITVSEDVHVPGGRAAVAKALGLEATPDRARFVAELTRLLPDAARRKNITIGSALLPLKNLPSAETVAIPLTTAVWSETIFRRPLASDDLLFAILSDPDA